MMDNRSGQVYHCIKIFLCISSLLFLFIEMDATFFPFLSSDSPEFQTDSLGHNPKGFLYLHCISPTTSSAFLLSFYLSLGVHPPVSLRGGRNVSGPLPFHVPPFSAQIIWRWMLSVRMIRECDCVSFYMLLGLDGERKYNLQLSVIDMWTKRFNEWRNTTNIWGKIQTYWVDEAITEEELTRFSF